LRGEDLVGLLWFVMPEPLDELPGVVELDERDDGPAQLTLT
jgi:hypothetical protein